jgi:DNA-binding NtrC family response regulator
MFHVKQCHRDTPASMGIITNVSAPVSFSSRLEYDLWRQGELEKMQPFAVQVIAAERAIIERAIELCQGNREEAAVRLGISRPTLYRKLGRPPKPLAATPENPSN